MQQVFSEATNKNILDNWFKGTGPAHLFIFYQKPYKKNESGDLVEVPGSREEFTITDGKRNSNLTFFAGDNMKLKGKAVYFMRCTQGKAINPTATNDSEVLFGEVSEHAVYSLNTIINNAYKPLIDKMSEVEWGLCEEEQKKEFNHTFDRFAKEVQEAIRSMQNNITLEPYPAEFQKDVNNILSNTGKNVDPKMIPEFERIFAKWSEQIEQTLEEADSQKTQDKDAGPRQELEHWKQRMRKLTCVSEQLRSKNCRTVYDVLTHYFNNQTDQSRPRDKINLATSRWSNIELRVTEALNEAKDNVKYLQTLEKFIEPLYDGDPDSIKDTLPALMNSIKMIHTIARYYNTNERMTGLFVKITNQMISNCKFNIINFLRIRRGQDPIGKLTAAQIAQGKKPAAMDDSVLWNHDEFPPEDLIKMFQSCLDLHESYIKQYEFTKERLQNVPKAKQFDFSPT